MKAIGYARVSTEGQVQDGMSLEGCRESPDERWRSRSRNLRGQTPLVGASGYEPPRLAQQCPGQQEI